MGTNNADTKINDTEFPISLYKDAKFTLNAEYFDRFAIEEVEKRRLYLNDMIDENVLETIVFHILRYNRLDAGIPKEKRQPIILYINSPGGSVSDGYGLIDAILTSETPVYTVNQALCASMGFLIFLAGDKRFSMPHAEFLMHDGSTFTMDSTAKARDRMEFEGQIEAMTKKYVQSRTKITDNIYDQKYRVEWYMLPEEAKKHGIVTDIIGIDSPLSDILGSVQ